jgi:hypothetical protein
MSGPRLIEEATKKSGIVWITVPGERARAAWHHWHDGAAYVITGGLEQRLPGLAEAERVEVTVPSKDSRGRLVTWAAAVSRVRPSSELWEAVVPAMHAKRLNAHDGDRQPERWMWECALLRLQPTGEIIEAPGSMPQDSGAAVPAPSPAVTSAPPPFVLGRRRSSRR